jgi:A/G-specific adenine glycosylase
VKQNIKQFQKIVWDFYKQNKRHFPWRETHDPYQILVSEIMLQQTQTNRVVIKYQEFLNKFPTLESLAKAKLSDVLQVWVGLGYNRRAKFLHECAKHICETYKGDFPKDFSTLVKLPGVGQSTAGALMNFAFNTPTVFIETNIRTVYLHHFFKNKKQKVADQELVKLLHKTLPTKNGRDWFYALYDYGTYLKQTLALDPARKSNHYKKQSKFEGSFRQKRSVALKLLLQTPQTLTTLATYLVKQGCVTEEDKVSETTKVLESLLKDNLISKHNSKFFVK